MSINTSSINAIELTEGDLDAIQEANQAFEAGSEAKAKELAYVSDEEILKLMAVLPKLAALSLKDKILLTNGWARGLRGEYVSPHVTVLNIKGEPVPVYPHCIYISAVRSFSPTLALPHSGQGFSTVQEWEIKHPAVLAFDVTVGGLDESEVDYDDEDDEEAQSVDDIRKAKTLAAIRRITLQWCAPGTSEWKDYEIGSCIPQGSAAYQVAYEATKASGAPIRKEGFSFIVTKKPSILPEDVQLIGKPDSATQARVKVKIWGTWLGTSQAEKFAGTLSKLCVDAMPPASSMEDTMMGGICLFEAPEGDFSQFCKAAAKGDVQPLPLTDVGLGQETAKGAPTYESAAACIKALTGKHVKREAHPLSQPVKVKGEVKHFDAGDIVWDSDEFVAFRNEWNAAAVSSGVWGRWVDDIMLAVLKKAVKYDDTLAEAQALHKEGKKAEAAILWEKYPYRFVSAGKTAEEGYYFFHKTDVRVELSALTMETSTQLENRSLDPKGSMFWELISGMAQAQ